MTLDEITRCFDPVSRAVLELLARMLNERHPVGASPRWSVKFDRNVYDVGGGIIPEYITADPSLIYITLVRTSYYYAGIFMHVVCAVSQPIQFGAWRLREAGPGAFRVYGNPTPGRGGSELVVIEMPDGSYLIGNPNDPTIQQALEIKETFHDLEHLFRW